MAQRSPEEIRSSIQANRAELAVSIDRLRGEVVAFAAVAGFVIGGGIAAFGGLFRRRR